MQAAANSRSLWHMHCTHCLSSHTRPSTTVAGINHCLDCHGIFGRIGWVESFRIIGAPTSGPVSEQRARPYRLECVTDEGTTIVREGVCDHSSLRKAPSVCTQAEYESATVARARADATPGVLARAATFKRFCAVSHLSRL